MEGGGKPIVLAASTSESTEYLRSTWRQMLLAATPARYARQLRVPWAREVETEADGQAKYVPQGLRVIESLLLEKFSSDDIAVCYPDQFPQFVGENTRVIGIHAHNPLGITFATDVYAQFYGAGAEPVNAAEFRRMITHPALRKHRPRLKIIVGGPGAWQIEKKNLRDEWGIDCLVHGEAEEVAAGLFEKALRGEPLPRAVEGHSPRMQSIPRLHGRATYGGVEITRGCGRGCQFCSVALRGGKSIPLDQILDNVRTQVAGGADMALLVTEDLFLYEVGPKFKPNVPALKRLLESVAAVPGLEYISLTHGTMAPVVAEPSMIEELTPIGVGRSVHQHPASTHFDKRYQCLFIGLETGSVRLFRQFMKGKSYPFRPEQWPDVVLKGMEILNRNNWFPFCTWIIGLPGETNEDTKQSLELLYALKDAKWCPMPTFFVPLEDTRLENKQSATIANLTDLQWEFFFTCWRMNLDFWRRGHKVFWMVSGGVPLYYFAFGRRFFGPRIKWPMFRLGHFPEWILRHRLYLDFSNRRQPIYRVPEFVPIPEHRRQPEIPDLRVLS